MHFFVAGEGLKIVNQKITRLLRVNALLYIILHSEWIRLNRVFTTLSVIELEKQSYKALYLG